MRGGGGWPTQAYVCGMLTPDPASPGARAGTVEAAAPAPAVAYTVGPVQRKYRVLLKTVVRTAADPGSDKIGILAKGGEIMADQEGVCETAAAIRVHFTDGWISTCASDGRKILELLQDFDDPVE